VAGNVTPGFHHHPKRSTPANYRRTQNQLPVIVKSVRHFRLENERTVLKRFQDSTRYIRPLLDEIVDPPDPPAIVLRHLDDSLLNASASRKLASSEVKYVARRIPEALKLLHEEGFVHTGFECFLRMSLVWETDDVI
jgi:serine/threonine protein kinase